MSHKRELVIETDNRRDRAAAWTETHRAAARLNEESLKEYNQVLQLMRTHINGIQVPARDAWKSTDGHGD